MEMVEMLSRTPRITTISTEVQARKRWGCPDRPGLKGLLAENEKSQTRVRFGFIGTN